jgi:ribokinase
MGEISSADILLIQLESSIESVYTAIKSAHDNDVTIILNPAPAQELDKQILKYVDIITPNIVEAEMLTGIKVTDINSLHSIVNKFFDYGINDVIITLGSKGYFAGTRDTMQIIPALKVAPIDTTGAGDVFSGSLAAFLSEGLTIEKAARMANAAASVSVTRLGAQVGAPKRVEIEKFLASYNAAKTEVVN